MNESCQTYEWVTVTHRNASCHTQIFEIIMTTVVFPRLRPPVFSAPSICHVTHLNESCHTCKWVMSNIWMGVVTHKCHHVRGRQSFRHLKWVMSHMWMSHSHTYEWVMSHIWMSHSHTYGCVMSHSDIWDNKDNNSVFMSEVTSLFGTLNESCHICGRVTSHIWMSHVTHINESQSHVWMCHVTPRYLRQWWQQ